MYIERVPNRNSPPAILLRESYREAGKVKKRTLANLSKWPADLVDGLKVLLGGGRAVARLDSAFDVVRTRPHGHVAAVFGCARRIGLERHLGARCAQRDLALALIVARVLAPCSKLATARGLQAETRRDSLADVLDLDEVDENNLYAAMDWLRERQERIENRLAKRHLAEGALVLYDLTSSYLEGRCCPLAKRGYSSSDRVWPAVRGGLSGGGRGVRATPPTRRPWAHRSTSCAAASGCRGWCWSATGAC